MPRLSPEQPVTEEEIAQTLADIAHKGVEIHDRVIITSTKFLARLCFDLRTAWQDRDREREEVDNGAREIARLERDLDEARRQRDEARAHQKTTADAANLIYDQESIRRLSQQLAEVTRQRDESDAALLWLGARRPLGVDNAVEAARARQSAAVKADETLPDQA